MLSVDVVTSGDELKALQPDYDRLQRLTKNTLPFALHDWHMAWCNHFLISTRRIRSQPAIHVVRNAERACVAIVPLILTRRGIGPVEITTLDMLGADPALTEIRTPLLQPGFEDAIAAAIQTKLSANPDYNWIQWSGIGGKFGESLARFAELQWQPPLLDYVLDLPPTWDLLRAGLKRNIRESIRHCYNSLKRDGHVFNMVVAQEPEEVKAAIDRFFVLHESRAELQGTVDHPNHFGTSISRRFLQDVCERFARLRIVRVFEMYVGDTLVAARIGFVVADSLYLYYSGFDPAWSKYSVMTTTVTEMVKYAIGQGLSTVNFSPGTDVSKTRWGPVALPIPQAAQVRRTVLSQLAWAGFRRAKSKGALPSWMSLLSRSAKKEWS
jgi:CelD/BcsL family acetyltransferase involved in cellulose biosynthesis